MQKMTGMIVASLFTVLLASPALAGKSSILRGPSHAASLQPILLTQPQPVPEVPGALPPGSLPAPSTVPGPTGYAPTMIMMAPVFHRVEYEDLHNIHPCGVPAIVQVPDPCACSCGHCNACCAPQCVSVQICVPPCSCADIKVRKDGRYVKYDYGKYEVEIKVRDGYVKVDYDD